jgi:hypothetical protein
MLQERGKYRDTTAEERAGLCEIERIWKRPNPCPLGTETIGKSTVAAHDGFLFMGAEMMIAG